MRDKLIQIFVMRPSPKIGADRVIELIAPELEKARRYDELGFVTSYVEPENYQEIKKKARKWDKICELNPDYETEYDGRTYYFCRFCDGQADDVGNDRHREDCPLVENEDLENGQGAP